MPEYKARVVYSGKGESNILENIGDDTERDVYASMWAGFSMECKNKSKICSAGKPDDCFVLI